MSADSRHPRETATELAVTWFEISVHPLCSLCLWWMILSD